MSDSTEERDFNFECATLLIHELVLLGVKTFVLSPGARSSALAIALANRIDIKTVIHFDERGSAFFALGAAKYSGVPSVLICTSGTAGGNYLPAVMEASNSETPLIVITADRPAELHNTGANQTITQTGLFFDYTVWQQNLPTPAAEFDVTLLRSLACKAFNEAFTKRGPVHLNAPFREPLVTTLFPPELSSTAFETDTEIESQLDSHAFETILTGVKNAKQGVVAVGLMPPDWNNDLLVEFLTELNWPCFVDITSQLRFAPPNKALPLLTAFDSYIRDDDWQTKHSPDCVLRIGQTITSKFLEKYLARCTGEYFQITSARKNIDPEQAATTCLRGSYRDIFATLSGKIPLAPSALLEDLTETDANAQEKIRTCGASAQSQFVLRAILNPRKARGLFIGNSLSIREADALVPVISLPHRVMANRGVSGIDGLIATTAGFAHAYKKPVTAILGDLSALHDLNSLALLDKTRPPVVLIIINNDGGLIFSKIPALEKRAELIPFFQTPHGYSFKHAALQFQLTYEAVATIEDFSKAYENAIESNVPNVIEVLCQSQ